MVRIEYHPSLFTWLADSAYNIYSQFGEDGLIDAIFRLIGEQNRWCVEIGAADGMFFSNTRRLIEKQWESLQIEADDDCFARLQERYKNNSKVRCYHRRVNLVTGPTLEDVMYNAGVPEDLDLLVIDVDGADYHLFNSLWKFHPRVVIVEYNPNPAHPEQIPALGEADVRTQAGFLPLQQVANARGYVPIGRTETNLICVRADLASHLIDPAIIAEAAKQQAGEVGYAAS